MRFEVLTVVKMLTLVFGAEDEGSIFLQNIGIYLQVHIVSQSTRPISTTVMVAYQPDSRHRNGEYKIKKVYIENDSCNKTILQ
jgi:hypothetical protein